VGTHPLPLRLPAAPPGVDYRGLLDSLGEACLSLDPSGRVVYCNPAGADLLGVRAASLVGRPLAAVLPDFAGSPAARACGRALATGEPQEARQAHGERFFHYRAYPAAQGAVVLIADATARRQFEEELVLSALRDRTLLDQLPAVHWTTDRDLRFTSSGGAALRQLGQSAGELIGRTLYDQFPTVDRDFFPIRLHLRALDGERVRYTQSHGGRHFESVLEPLRDQSGRVTGVTGLAQDVTELLLSLEEQRRGREQVLQAQKLESLGLLAAGLAHDFNNLLVGMLTAADLLRRDLEPGSEQHQLAELIKKAAGRASALNRQMLLYAGKGMAVRRPVALEAVAEESLSLLAAGLPKNVALVKSFAPDLPAVEADAAQLAQLITNLVVNAAEALGARGGRVCLAAGVEEKEESGRMKEECTVHPSSFILHPSVAAPHVYLEVSDDGCGLTADVLARIFDPFFTTKGKGRGLGLCSVLGTVRAHRGGIRATSAPGAGTTIRILLPAAPGPAAPEPRPGTPPPPRGHVVLVIDDEPVVRGVTSRALARMGLEVLSAAGAREGLELFRACPDAISLVLLDLGLPGQDSLQTLAALRAERPSLRVILTTGSEPGPAVDPSGAEPPVVLLPKPYTVHALLETIGRALEGLDCPPRPANPGKGG
jgi:PAS domain S-box-containing protein